MALLVGASGGAGVSAMQANAATYASSSNTTTNSTTNTGQNPPLTGEPMDPSKGGHVGTNGVKEELLTGDTAEKVKTAALAAVSGGTIERVETDAEGATYEAHMKKSDGSEVTVKVDSNFKVIGIETGGPGPNQKK